jgi:chromosome partitioning protein
VTHIIVVGNEKGGSGKSTTAMHLIAGLMQAGRRVGSIDLDVRQGTLTRYIENRQRTEAAEHLGLTMPVHRRIAPSDLDSAVEARAMDGGRLVGCLEELAQHCDIIVIDTPGSDIALSRHAHSWADTLITPLNDSFIDLDLLAAVDPDTGKVKHPSRYAEMVWEQKKARAKRDGGSIDWVVMRNRLGSLNSRNKQAMEKTIQELSRRIGFRVAPGFSERVIFRELFLKGLTLLDMRRPGTGIRLNMSHIAARQEVRMLLQAIGLPAHNGTGTGNSSGSDPI